MLFYVPVKADQFVLHKLAVLRGGGLFFFAQQMVHRDVEIPGDLCQLIRRQAFDAPRLVIGKRRARHARLPAHGGDVHARFPAELFNAFVHFIQCNGLHFGHNAGFTEFSKMILTITESSNILDIGRRDLVILNLQIQYITIFRNSQ